MLHLALYTFHGSIPALRKFLPKKCKVLSRSYKGRRIIDKFLIFGLFHTPHRQGKKEGPYGQKQKV
jgi:hypothetical protein